jgi:hypothetical protein
MGMKDKLTETWQARNVPTSVEDKAVIRDFFERHPWIKKGYFLRDALMEKIAREDDRK